jgi:molecular chaperone DnaJ
MTYQDHYAVLGVSPGATSEEIKSAYRRLALATHPDRHPDDPDAEARFRAISGAYAVLSDPGQRARYDTQRLLPEALIGGVGQGITLATAKDFFAAVVGDVFGRQRRERRRGRDIRYTLTVELGQAVAGGEHEIGFEASGACSTCSGSGTRPGARPPITCPLCQGRGEVKGEGFLRRYSPCGRCGGVGMIQQDPCGPCSGRGSRREKRSFHVRLPPGTESGAEKLVEGQGEPGQFGGAPGHLRVTVNVRPHPWLRREGLDIVGEVYVSVGEAARGGKIPVPTLTGVAMVEIPIGVTTGAKLRLRGKGVPAEAGRPGDQIVAVIIETPRITTAAGAPATHLGSALDALERAFEADPQLLPKRAAQRSGA